MFVEKDTEYNVLYISFRDEVQRGVVARTVEAFPGVNLKLDSEDKLVGIEIFSTEEVIGVPATEIDFSGSGELVGVKEAAELVGKDRANFLRDFASQPDFPKPRARLASGQVWLSTDIERYLEKRRTNYTLLEWLRDQDDYNTVVSVGRAEGTSDTTKAILGNPTMAILAAIAGKKTDVRLTGLRLVNQKDFQKDLLAEEPPAPEDCSEAIKEGFKEAYKAWASKDFKDLPSFMAGVDEVHPTGPSTHHWVIKGPLGTSIEFNVEHH